ncbi:MAG: MFS transporter [Verrucomicrobiota bacterium]
MMKPDEDHLKWYQGINSYQWLVLTVCSLGWIFDVFEGQVFVASMREAMPSLVPTHVDQGHIDFLNKMAMASFLIGGALGGVLFGSMADRIGRSKTLAITIIVYSLFTFITAFAQTPWQMIILRFVVALGTGGEWAVGAAFVAEVFPKRSRPAMGSIFHGSSVLGTILAVIVGAYVIGNQSLGENSWRWGFAIGALPAVLVLWIRWKVKEPEKWVQAREAEGTGEKPQERAGSVRDLFDATHWKLTVLGVALATTGIATFWGVHIFGKNTTLDLHRNAVLEQAGLSQDQYDSAEALAVLEEKKGALKRAEMTGMLLNTLGAGVGLVCFGAISGRMGRRGAFLFYYLGGFAVTLLLFQGVAKMDSWPIAAIALPIFGFFTVGMHAGYAIYFPELYPTRLRSVGSGFCFNVGRFTAAPILVITALLQKSKETGGMGWSNELLASWMSVLFLLGAAIALMGPETKDQELPE